MILRRDKRTVPQLNTTSTADISFILLVFFLVMTSMDVDKGLTRMLPPMVDESAQDVAEVERGNVLSIEIMPSGRLLVNGKPFSVGGLRSRIVSFVGNSADRNRQMIMLNVDRKAPYDAYFNVQNEIVASYRILRDRYAARKYGRAYAACTPGQREAIRKLYPQRITETTVSTEEGGGR